MKQTRKNPFAQATAFAGPPQTPQTQYSEEITEDPTFQEVSQKKAPFHAPAGFQTRKQNPFGGGMSYQAEEDYSDFNPPNQQPGYSNQQSFGNSGFATGERRAQPFGQVNMNPQNDFQDGYSKPGYNPVGGNPAEQNAAGYLNEPPLLEDLGIDIKLIMRKIFSIISLRKVNKEMVDDADLAGPILVAIIFGTILLLRGRVQFGYIYGFGLTGCMGIYCLLKAMVSREQSLDLYTIMSVLGYCLLPFTILASVTLFLPVFNIFGGVLSLLIICWSTYMATQFIDVMLSLSNKRMIIAYPIFLFYMCFLLLAIF